MSILFPRRAVVFRETDAVIPLSGAGVPLSPVCDAVAVSLITPLSSWARLSAAGMLPETRDWKKREAGCAVDLNGHSYVKAIRIRLLDYYEGSHYPTDMCVSEFKVYGTASGR